MSRAFPKLRAWSGPLALLLVAGVLGARLLTFDPAAEARALAAQLDLVPAPDLGHLKGIARATSVAETATELDRLDVSALSARADRIQADFRAMRQRFHHGSEPCARYPGDGDTPVDVDATARAVVSAGFAARLSEVAEACGAWQAERDDRLHDGDAASEILAFFSERADPWTRLGVLLRRGATLDAMRAQAKPRRTSSLPEGRAREAVALCDARGSILPALMRVSRWKKRVDLRAGEAHLIQPGMSQPEVRAILGDPVEEGAAWQYHGPSTRVLFDASGRVAAVVSRIADLRGQVYAGEELLVRLDRESLVAALGEPTWKGDGEMLAAADADEILGYERREHATVLYFLGGELKSVELRRSRP